MAISSLKRLLPAAAALGALLSCSPAPAYESSPFGERQAELISSDQLPKEPEAEPEQEPEAPPLAQEEPEGWKEFFQQRTQIGLGWDGTYDSNPQFQDNNRESEYINTLEGLLLFVDPRGALLYGSQWEVNAFRHMNRDRNAVNHNVVSFVDFDPGLRTQYHLSHTLNISNRLVFGSPGVDILRRSSDFQRSVEHNGEGRIVYAVTDDDDLVARASYTLFDDQVKDDASTDRESFKGTLDLDHAITRTWKVFGGAAFKRSSVPGDKIKNSNAYGGRLGARYELSRNEFFIGILEVDRPQLKDKERDIDFNYQVLWEHLVGPRTKLRLGYLNTRRTSFSSGRTEFRSSVPNFSLTYELTPLISLEFLGSYEKQKSAGTSTSSAVVHRTYDLGLRAYWQVREQSKITLDFTTTRSKSHDYTHRTVTLGFETTF